MPETLRINLARGVSGVSQIANFGLQFANARRDPDPQTAIIHSPSDTLATERQEKELAQLCETIGTLAGKLDRLYEQTVVHSRGDIAKLAVEIARKIVMCEIPRGGYDIQAIIEEALKGVPTHQDLVVRVNPQDAPLCEQLRSEHPDGEFAKLQFVPDWSIARANCLIETPKGVVRSFVEEGLERIREALEKSQ
jgi:flagellar biosynthesis/type III secretory pathway protein FliH